MKRSTFILSIFCSVLLHACTAIFLLNLYDKKIENKKPHEGDKKNILIALAFITPAKNAKRHSIVLNQQAKEVPQEKLNSNKNKNGSPQYGQIKNTQDHYFSLAEVDYPAEFIEPLDFDTVLYGVVMVKQSFRVQLFVDKYGLVQDVSWSQQPPAEDVAEKLSEYLSQQQLVPARKNGRAVNSRITLEFSLGLQLPSRKEVPFVGR